MNPVLAWLNDYRDTLSYSVTAIVCVLAFHFVGAKLCVDIGSGFIWARESARWGSWILSPKKTVYMPVIGTFVFANNCCGFLVDYLLGNHTDLLFRFFIQTLNLTFIMFYIYRVGSFKLICKIWYKELFDWPRKQKPPKHRSKAISDTIKQLLAALLPRPALIPQATGFIDHE